MLQMLEKLGYTDVIYVAGSDRVASFDKLFNDYNGKEYNFDSITVINAGERDPDAEGAEGMSASKMRAAAASGDLKAFAQGVPDKKLAQNMYDAVRKGMGVKDAEPVEEGDLVVDKGSLANYLRDTIKDYVMQEEDVEKLAQLLKFMVGKTIKARGDRFVITKEDVQEALGLVERELTKGEEKEKEKLVKGMKKNKDDFKQRYGKDAEAVMYAAVAQQANAAANMRGRYAGKNISIS